MRREGINETHASFEGYAWSPTIAGTWSCARDQKWTSSTQTRHAHDIASNRAATTRVYYTKVTEFPAVHMITWAPLRRKR
jgi:hypothetical protein